MTIKWPDNLTTICHGNTRTVGEAAGPLDFTIDVAPGQIQRLYASGGGPDYEADDNDPATVTFGVRIVYASVAAAAAAVATLAATDRNGTLLIGSDLQLNSNGNAALTRILPTQIGKTVLCYYTFQGLLEAQP